MAYQVRMPRWLRGLSTRPTQRPDKFTLNRNSPFFRGLVFAGLGGMAQKTKHYHDSSLYGNHGTLTNMDPATDWVWSPELGRWALRLDAGSELVQGTATNLPTAAGAAWTIATWWRPDAYSSLANVFGFGTALPNDGGGGSQYNRYLITYLDAYYVWGGSADWNTGIADDRDGLWHHVAVTCGGTDLRFYRDGVLRAGPKGRPAFATSGTSIAYGSGHSAAASSVNADVCDGIVSSRALSAAEISALADPSNVMLEVGGVPLIESKRTYFPVAVAPQVKKLYWPRKSNRRNPILSMEEILYVASNLGRDSDAPHLWRGLVGAWPLQEPGGVTAYDVSGWGRHGTLTNVARVVTTTGRGAVFNGTNAFGRVVDNRLASVLTPTVSVLLRGSNVSLSSGNQYLVSRWNTGADVHFGLRLDNANPRWFVYDGGTKAVTFADLTLTQGNIHHLIARYDGTTGDCFLDGRSSASTLSGSAITPAADEPLHIGSQAGVSNWFAGSISLVQLWRRPLTPAEIQQLYADPWAMYRLRKKVPHFFMHTGPRVVDAAFSNDSPFDVSESIGTVTATDAIGAKTWEIVSQIQE